jgi:glycosyltransferase involved in cell wall biosynthesis
VVVADRWPWGSVAQRLAGLREVNRRAHLPAEGARAGRALLSYLATPLLDAEMPTSHTQHWESAEMARTLAALGFDVDVISYQNRWFRPRAPYDVVVDVRRNLERLAPGLPPSTRRLMHCDTADILSLVTAEHQRLLDLQRRRGVTLQPRRYERPNRGVEHAHAATVLGNDVTLETFRYAGIPLFPLPVATAVERPEDVGRDHDAVRHRFLWLGSAGMVHKGLDLVLEVFAAAPDLHLTVVGPVEGEPDFVGAYRRELYETPNIDTRGFVDVGSSAFADIARSVVGLVYPSSSEGCAGAVVTALHAGLVPVVSPTSGVDVPPEVGVVLDDCAPATIAAAVRGIAAAPAAELAARSRAAWAHARDRYTRAAFRAGYRAALEQVL